MLAGVGVYAGERTIARVSLSRACVCVCVWTVFAGVIYKRPACLPKTKMMTDCELENDDRLPLVLSVYVMYVLYANIFMITDWY